MIGVFLNERRLLLSGMDGEPLIRAELDPNLERRAFQLAAQWRSADLPVTAFSLAVTAHETATRLTQLLAQLDAEGLKLAGFVDAAVLAANAVGLKDVGMVLQLQSQAAVVTRVIESAGKYRRAAFLTGEACGWLDLRRACLQCIADHMIRQSRFDPLHDIKDEQYLQQHLREWLDEAIVQGSTQIRMTALGKPIELTIGLSEFVQATEPTFKRLRQLVVDSRLPGVSQYLLLPDWLLEIPGAREFVAAVSSSAYFYDEMIIARAAARLTMPMREDHAVTLSRQAHLGAFAESEIKAFVPDLGVYRKPTHLLFGSRVWPVSGSIALGRDATNTIVLPQGMAGLSRHHCTLQVLDSECTLIDHSRFGTWVNDERVRGRQRVAAGDRVRLGDPGIELSLITVDDAYGKASR
jgi:hypothetical protein